MTKSTELQRDLFSEEVTEVADVGVRGIKTTPPTQKNDMWEVTYCEPKTVYLSGKNEEDVRKKLALDPRLTEIAMRKHVVAPLNPVTRREAHRRKYSTEDNALFAVSHPGDLLHTCVYEQLNNDELHAVYVYRQILESMQENYPFDLRWAYAEIGALLQKSSILFSFPAVHRTYLMLGNLIEQLEGTVKEGCITDAAMLSHLNTSVVSKEDYTAPAELINERYHVKYKQWPQAKSKGKHER